MLRLVNLAAVLLLVSPAIAQEKKPQKQAKKAVPQIGHMVYFKLKDPTPENRRKLVDACKRLLANHEGVVFFAAGARAEAFKHEFNDQSWDVALHLVFVNKAAHDRYQDHPDHLKFIEENRDLWSGVRVFDSEITPTPRKKAEKKGKSVSP